MDNANNINMGTTASKQISQERNRVFSDITTKEIQDHDCLIDTMLVLNEKNINNLNNSCKAFIPNISYGIIVNVLTPKSFTILCPIECETVNNKYKLYRFTLHLRNVIVPELETDNKNEKEASLMAINIISKLLVGTRVYINNLSLDIDGKILCDLEISLSNRNVSRFIIDNKLGISNINKKPDNWLSYIDKK